MKKNQNILLSETIYIKNKSIDILDKDKTMKWKNYLVSKKLHYLRLCYHKNKSDLIHKMILLFNKNLEFPYHKQKKFNVSYLHLYGMGEIRYYDDQHKIKKYVFDQDNKFFNLPRKNYRSVKSLSSILVFFEITQGPYVETDTIWY